MKKMKNINIIMKKKKSIFKLLPILLLLNCFSNLQANNKILYPSTGEIIDSDTIVQVPINIIRNVNSKLIERKYLLNINSNKDSIINLKDSYIFKQDSIIIDLKDRIVKNSKINEDLQKQYEKERKKKIIYGSVAGGCLVGIIATITGVVLSK